MERKLEKTMKAGLMAVVMACGACGSTSEPWMLDAITGNNGETSGETSEESSTQAATSTSKSVLDIQADWKNAETGEFLRGLGIGDLLQFDIKMDAQNIEATLKLDAAIPSETTDDLLYYGISFVIYDPDNAFAQDGLYGGMAQKLSYGGFGPSGTKFEASVTNSSSDNVPTNTLTTAVNNSTIRLLFPLTLIPYLQAQVCNIEIGAIVETHTLSGGYVADSSARVQLNDGICQGYTRSRCWYDNKCTDMISSRLVTKDECKEAMSGKGWGPDADDCHAI